MLPIVHAWLTPSLLVSALLFGLTASIISGGTGESPAQPDGSRASLPPSIDLRPVFERLGLSPRRQGARGTCSVFTVTGALEYAVAARERRNTLLNAPSAEKVAANERRGTRLSVEFLNWAGHKAAGRSADGGFFSEIWKGYETYGICPESDQPYQDRYNADLRPGPAALKHASAARNLRLELRWIKEWDVHSGLTSAQFAEVKRALAGSRPVCGGFRWPKRSVWKDSVLQMCAPDEVYDGHSVLLVGYRDDPRQPGGGVFLIRNSAGDGSDGSLPYVFVMAYMNDAAYITESVRG